MGRIAKHLVVMAVVGSIMLGFTGGALSQEVTDERFLNADKDPNNWLMYSMVAEKLPLLARERMACLRRSM